MANGAVRVRKEVSKLSSTDPVLHWFARAVADMKTRPLDDPTSWRYQAAIHEYTRDTDPLQKPSDKQPADKKRFWTRCQHGGWFFLPWHRIYLHFFEQIVAATVVKLGGPTD